MVIDTVTAFTLTVTTAVFVASALAIAVIRHGPAALGAVHCAPMKLPQGAVKVTPVLTEPVTTAAKVKVLP